MTLIILAAGAAALVTAACYGLLAISLYWIHYPFGRRKRRRNGRKEDRGH